MSSAGTEEGMSGSVEAMHFENAAEASAALSLQLRAPKIQADISQACFIYPDFCRTPSWLADSLAPAGGPGSPVAPGRFYPAMAGSLCGPQHAWRGWRTHSHTRYADGHHSGVRL